MVDGMCTLMIPYSLVEVFRERMILLKTMRGMLQEISWYITKFGSDAQHLLRGFLQILCHFEEELSFLWYDLVLGLGVECRLPCLSCSIVSNHSRFSCHESVVVERNPFGCA